VLKKWGKNPFFISEILKVLGNLLNAIGKKLRVSKILTPAASIIKISKPKWIKNI